MYIFSRLTYVYKVQQPKGNNKKLQVFIFNFKNNPYFKRIYHSDKKIRPE